MEVRHGEKLLQAQDKETPTLVSLEDHDRRVAALPLPTYPRPNGIACPKCGCCLLDSNEFILFSHPPKASVHCGNCHWRGVRNI